MPRSMYRHNLSGRLRSLPPHGQAAVIGVAVILYAIVFVVAVDSTGPAIASAALLPASIAAWIASLRGGFITLGVVWVVTLVLAITAGGYGPELMLTEGLVPTLSWVCIVLVVGKLADLGERLQSELAARFHAEKELLRSEATQRALLDAIPDIVLRIRPDGIVTEVRGTSQTTRSGADEPNSFLLNLVPDTELPTLMAAMERVAHYATTDVIEFTGQGNDTGTVLELHLAAVSQDEIVGVLRDITQRKLAERQDRLEEIIRIKDEFLASVSHELRTPLTAVLGFAEELREQYSHFSDEEIRQLISVIADQSDEVAHILEDLLVVARRDIGQLVLAAEPLDLHDQATSVLTGLSGTSHRATVSGAPARVWADPTRTRQVLRNLISNAVRYGGDHVEIWISREADLAHIEVRDDGPGIQTSEREQIFEAYGRARQIVGQPASVGLGLTVSRQLARVMGGDLEYEFRDGWSCFRLSLPVDRVEARTGAA